MTTQNVINKGVFNEIGINHIAEELTNQILKLCSQKK